MKNDILLSEMNTSGDTFTVYRRTGRGTEWKAGPLNKFSVLNRNAGTAEFWNSPCGKFMKSGLPTDRAGQPII